MTSAPNPIAEAVSCLQAGQTDAAVRICQAILAQQPQHADALGLLGLMALQRRAFSEAESLLCRAIAARRDAPMLHFHHGATLAAMGGRENDAIRSFATAAALDPKNAEAHHQLGNMFKRLRRYDEAISSLSTAVALQPDNATIWLNLGVAQLELGRRTQAIASFKRAVSLVPNMPEAHNVLGAALIDDGAVTEAQAAFATALRLRPNYAAAHNNLARTYRAQGRMAEAVAEYRAALAVAPDAGTHSNLVYALNFMAEVSPEEVWREHAEWGRRYAEPTAASNSTPSSRASAVAVTAYDRDRRLRIGFVSPDLVNHAVAYFFEPLLAARSRSEWEVFCYSDSAVPDRVTERLRGLADHWQDTATLRDEQLETQIRQDRIDVLVDLAGHTAHHRLLVFARKPAPVQLTWLGYPNTTGLRSIDYRVTDALCDPPGTTEQWHSENLLRLPRSFLCYRPAADAPPVGEFPALRTGRITFASFSNYAKVSQPCLETWAAVLKSVPDSRLLLKSRGLADRETAARIHARFWAAGISKDRVILDGTLVSVAAHLQQYHGVDIALDPFPYHGTTTTCEALWMGVPVITLAGATHVSRVGVSLVTQIGHPEWSASSIEAYVARAQELAIDRPKLAKIRSQLRAEMQASPLCDQAGFATDFAVAIRAVWREFCAKTT